MQGSSSLYLIIIAIIGDILTTLVKLIAGILSSSQAVIAEGIHSMVDVTNQLLMLFGLQHSRKHPDELHPFGYGQERYFWTFIISIMVMSIASVIVMLNGLQQMLVPEPLGEFGLAYLVLLSSFSFQLVSFAISSSVLMHGVRGLRGLLSRVRHSKDVATSTVWLEDSFAIVGIGIALTGLFLSQYTGSSFYDGLASFLIGVLTLVMAFLLARDSKNLLLNETVSPSVYEQVVSLVRSFPEVQEIKSLDTLVAGPGTALLKAHLLLDPKLEEIAKHDLVETIRQRLGEEVSGVHRTFIKYE